jgi:7-cyano-7-deazaguanine synthase
MNEKAIVLLSGGQDSTTCLYWALSNFDNVEALCINYGQSHLEEVWAAKEIAKLANVSFELVNIDNKVLKGGSILGIGEIHEGLEEGIASSFVPFRNMLFLTIAANRAYLKDAKNLVIGVNSIDYSGYPDCREIFIWDVEAALESASEREFKIHTPLIDMDKKQIVELAKTMPQCWEALKYSHTCYKGLYPPCGVCAACILRAKGFEEAGEVDPIFERESKGKFVQSLKGKIWIEEGK